MARGQAITVVRDVSSSTPLAATLIKAHHNIFSMLQLLSVLSLWSSVLLVSASLTDQDYVEELFMKNLPDGRVLATFDFVTTWNSSPVTFAQPSLGKMLSI